MAEVCSYAKRCLRLPVNLVRCIFFWREPQLLHHICQAKYEHDNNIESDMVFICRVCIGGKYNLDIDLITFTIDDTTDNADEDDQESGSGCELRTINEADQVDK